MITRIVLRDVACFRQPAALETTKKVNLIYGLNGTGKSTLTDYLYDPTNMAYSSCSLTRDADEEVLVYNQSFVRDYFYQVEELPGIFTLSKENKEAEERVKAAEQKLADLKAQRQTKHAAIDARNEETRSRRLTAENRTWEIKTSYSGGDRVLEYCLSGLMGRKEALFNHLFAIEKPPAKPPQTVEMLRAQVEELRQGGDRKIALLPEVNFSAAAVESNAIFGKPIVGSSGSRLSAKIKELENSDWVRKGLDYLPAHIGQEPLTCPFCQEPTMTQALFQELKTYFDESYEKALQQLRSLLSTYESAIRSLNAQNTYTGNRFVAEKADTFETIFFALTSKLTDNRSKIQLKLTRPSETVSLSSSASDVDALNRFIRATNESVARYNKRIENRDSALAEMKSTFWSIMRWEYDQTLSAYREEVQSADSAVACLANQVKELEAAISEQEKEIQTQQKRTVNIEEAIQRINSGLLELGIDGFHIEKHSEVRYRIVRDECCENTFETLSEGEKMIISLLYFRERCRGRKDVAETAHKKTVVIDDPVSSLSHIYVFNVGQMIKHDFFNSSDYEQVFVLTHSLYFFYELTDSKHERRKQCQDLFRIFKSSAGSRISSMEYEEIQNDYQSYWRVVTDESQSPALIANCMRNIIEYFFNFIEKRDLNNVFQKPSLKDARYQAFYRYMNRESHSLGQNIFDFKEFDYSAFRDALRLVFEESGYSEHYLEMTKAHGT